MSITRSQARGNHSVAIDCEVASGVLIVRLHGEIDHHAVETMRSEIEQQLVGTHYRGLVMSFHGIEFMDSSGLGLILGRYRTITQRNGRMALCEVHPSLRRIFEMSGILKIISVFEREDDALRHVKEA